MIVESFIYCAFLVLFAWLAYAAKTRGALPCTFGLAGIFLVFTLGFVLFQGALAVFASLIVVTIAARRAKLRARWFGLCSVGVVLLIFGTMMVRYIPVYHEHQRLVAKFPVEDLSPRLSYETTPASATSPVDGAAHQPQPQTPTEASPVSTYVHELEEMFGAMNYKTKVQNHQGALNALSQVHASFVEDFIAQPGFGRYRVPIRVQLREEHLSDPPPVRIPQPDPPPPASPESPGDLAHEVADKADEPAPAANAGVNPYEPTLPQFNIDQVLNFASPRGTGFISQPRQVRGFQSHAFRLEDWNPKWTSNGVRWNVAKLELISLLKHRPAAAYVSEHLPAMDELKDAATRPLDAFEMDAVVKLREGQELVAAFEHDEQRMVGSIRAAKQCLDCHQVQRGALLGAFTYRFYREPARPEPKIPAKTVTLRSFRTSPSPIDG